MPQYIFGSGDLTLVGEAANATPRRFGVLQEISVDVSFNKKELMGQKKFPVAVAQGAGKIECKAKSASIYGEKWAELFFNVTPTANQVAGAMDEVGTIPATPYQLTATNGATFLTDLGVIDVSSGNRMTKVASSPSTGQYSVNAGTGVYTFAAADTTKVVRLSYTYTKTATGKQFTVTNSNMGTAAYFAAHLTNSYDSDGFYMKLFRCIGTKLTNTFKNEDFDIAEFDFSAFADASDNVLLCGFSDQ